mgnify:CR=1 FL=1
MNVVAVTVAVASAIVVTWITVLTAIVARQIAQQMQNIVFVTKNKYCYL